MTEERLDNNVAFAKECVRRGRTLFPDELKHLIDHINSLERTVKYLEKELKREESSL